MLETISTDGGFTRAERTGAAAVQHALAVGMNIKRLMQAGDDSSLVRFDLRRMGGKSNQEISIGWKTGLWAID